MEAIYDSSPDGQKNFLIELFNGIKSVNDGKCLGAYYWDPIFVSQNGCGSMIYEATDKPGGNVVSNTTLFDFEHVALPALKAFGLKESTHNVYYYCEDYIPKVIYKDKIYNMEDVGDNWFSFEYTYDDNGLTFTDSDGNKVFTVNGNENSDLYGVMLDNYYNYLYDGKLYASPDDINKKYYIVGSTTDWEAKDAGIFSNYWATGQEWLDEMQYVSPGKYSITLTDAIPDTEYEFSIYLNKDWDVPVLPKDFNFTVENKSNVTFIYDYRTNTVMIDFSMNNL